MGKSDCNILLHNVCRYLCPSANVLSLTIIEMIFFFTGGVVRGVMCHIYP